MSSHLLSTDGTLVLSSSLAEELGSAEAAIILQQVHYWLSKGCGKIIDGVRWIYNTYDGWQEQIPWLSKWKLRQVFYHLREEGYLKFIQPSDHGRDRTGYYSINYEMLETPSVSHVCYTALASVENQQMQMWLFTHHIDTETTPKISTQTNTDVVVEKEDVEENSQPTEEELSEALAEVRRLSPEIQINSVVQKAILNYWANFPAAVQRVKKAVRENWKVGNLTGLLIKSLKQPPEEAKQAASETKRYPRPSLEQLNILGSKGNIEYTRLNEPGYPEVVAVNGVPWWNVLGLLLDDLLRSYEPQESI